MGFFEAEMVVNCKEIIIKNIFSWINCLHLLNQKAYLQQADEDTFCWAII